MYFHVLRHPHFSRGREKIAQEIVFTLDILNEWKKESVYE